MLNLKNKFLIMLPLIIIVFLLSSKTVDAREKDIDIEGSYDEKVVYIDEIPQIGEEVYFNSSDYYPDYEFNGNGDIGYLKDLTVMDKILILNEKDNNYKDKYFYFDDDTIFGLKFVNDDNNYKIVSFQKVDWKTIKDIIKNQTNYGTKHYFNGYYNHPRIGCYYKKTSSKNELKVLYINFHVRERKENTSNLTKTESIKVENINTDKIDKEILEILLDLDKSLDIKDLNYKDYIPVENIKKTEVYNDSMGMEYFIDYNDGETIHIENKKENSIYFYVAIRDIEGKYTFYKIENDMGTFNYLLERSKNCSLYKPTIIVAEGKNKDNIERMTLYLRKK